MSTTNSLMVNGRSAEPSAAWDVNTVAAKKNGIDEGEHAESPVG
jgi:hypothetical protein